MKILKQIGNIYITFSEFNGSKGLDIRKYYEDQKTGDLKPTQKGIWLGWDDYQALKDFFESDENNSKIIDFFES